MCIYIYILNYDMFYIVVSPIDASVLLIELLLCCNRSLFWCRYADSLPAGFAERIARELEVRIHGRYDGHFVSPG